MRTKNTFVAILLTFLVQVPTSPSDLNGAKEKEVEFVRRINSTLLNPVDDGLADIGDLE